MHAFVLHNSSGLPSRKYSLIFSLRWRPLGEDFDSEKQEIFPPKILDTIERGHFEQDGIKQTHGISVKIANNSAETAPQTW
jgi:hypothetical protein